MSRKAVYIYLFTHLLTLIIIYTTVYKVEHSNIIYKWKMVFLSMIILRSYKQETAPEFARLWKEAVHLSKGRMVDVLECTLSLERTLVIICPHKSTIHPLLLFLPMPSSLCLLVTLIYLWSETDMHSASLISIENDTV